MGIIRTLSNFFYPGETVPKAQQCAYGSRMGAEGNCTVLVQPGEGFRYGGAIFCSEAHALLDIEEAAL